MEDFSLLPNIQDQRDQETTISITDYFDPKTLVVAFDLSFQIEELGKAWEKALQIHQEAVDFGREVIPKHPFHAARPRAQVEPVATAPTGRDQVKMWESESDHLWH